MRLIFLMMKTVLALSLFAGGVACADETVNKEDPNLAYTADGAGSSKIPQNFAVAGIHVQTTCSKCPNYAPPGTCPAGVTQCDLILPPGDSSPTNSNSAKDVK